MLLAFDASFQSLENGSYFHLLDSIVAILDYLTDEVNIGIVTYDSVVSFYEINEGEIIVYKNIDKDNLCSPISHKDLFLNVKTKK